MIKPGILSDEERRNIWVCGEGTLEAIAVAQNDYCYKETCKQIKADILAIDYSSSNPLNYWEKVTRYTEALQGLEG